MTMILASNKTFKMSRSWLFIFLAFFLGCASQPVLLDGLNQVGAPVCLEDQSNIPAFVRKFFATRDLATEEGRIDYLLQSIHDSKLTFIRNKVEYTSASAAEFFRWKLNRMEKRHHIKVKTAQDFVSHVTSGSRTSGRPYAIIFPDGSRRNLQNVLQNELEALESCLQQYPEDTSSKQAGIGDQSVSTTLKDSARAVQ